MHSVSGIVHQVAPFLIRCKVSDSIGAHLLLFFPFQAQVHDLGWKAWIRWGGPSSTAGRSASWRCSQSHAPTQKVGKAGIANSNKNMKQDGGYAASHSVLFRIAVALPCPSA